MRKSQPAAYSRSREQVTTAEACFFICMMGLVTAGAAFAQNPRVPETASSYVVDGLALGALVDPEVRHLVAINAARVNCFLNLRDASERKDSKRGAVAALLTNQLHSARPRRQSGLHQSQYRSMELRSERDARYDQAAFEQVR